MLEADPKLQVAAVADRAAVHRTLYGGCRIEWRGRGIGPPLVLLHGDAGSRTHWIRNVLVLAERFRVIVPDISGYGGSATSREPVTPESLAASLVAGLAALPFPPRDYSLAGFSFGGIIAGHLGSEKPALGDRLLNQCDRLRWVEAFRAGLSAIHDSVAAIQAESVVQFIQPFSGSLITAVSDPTPGL